MPFVSTDSAVYDATTNAYRFSIPENATGGSVIGQVRFAHEGFSMASYSTFGEFAAMFEIESDGTVRLAADVPLVKPGGAPRSDLSLQVSFFGVDADGTVVTARTAASQVTVTPVDHAPVITVASRLSDIDEHEDADTVVATFSATDRNGDAVTVELGGPQADLFAIEQRVGVYSIVLKHPERLDYESLGTDKTVKLTITASSQADGAARQTVREVISLPVNDVDEPVKFAREMFRMGVKENDAGAVLDRLEAHDPDEDPISFELTGDSADLFEVTADSRVRLKEGVSLNYEALAEGYVDIGVTATATHQFADGRSSTTSDTAVVRIDVHDMPEAPVVTVTMLQDVIVEHAAAGTPVARLAIEAHGEAVTVTLGGTHANLFRRDGDMIVIADSDGFDFETLKDGVDLKIVATTDGASLGGSVLPGMTAEAPVPARIGDDTLLTWFDADNASPNGGHITGFTVLTGYDEAVTSAHLADGDILIRASRVGRDDNGDKTEEIIEWGTAAHHLDGGNGNDQVNGGSGDDRLYGGDGNDGLYGASGDDRLYGGDGNDSLTGGDGRDVMTGGADRDRFYVSDTAASLDRADVITDFAKGEDKIYLGEERISGKLVKRTQVWIKRRDADGDRPD